MQPVLSAAGPENLQLQLRARLVPEMPRFRRAVLSAGRRAGRPGGCDRGVVVWMAGGEPRNLSGLRGDADQSDCESRTFAFASGAMGAAVVIWKARQVRRRGGDIAPYREQWALL